MKTWTKTCAVRRAYDGYIAPAASVGSRVEKQFRLTRDEHFNSIYTEIGEVDIQENINSYKNGCSLKAILDRCQLMPVHDKIRYLNQTEQGFSVDLSHMPKDGTEAQIMLQSLKKDHPDVVDRVRNGETFETIVSKKFSPASTESKKEKSEVISDGT